MYIYIYIYMYVYILYVYVSISMISEIYMIPENRLCVYLYARVNVLR